MTKQLIIKTWDSGETWNTLVKIISKGNELVIYYNKEKDEFGVVPWPAKWEVKYFNLIN